MTSRTIDTEGTPRRRRSLYRRAPGGPVLRYFDPIGKTHYTYSDRHGPSLAASAAQASATTCGTATGRPVERLIPVRYACTVDGATSNNSAAARTVNPMRACQARNSAGVNCRS